MNKKKIIVGARGSKLAIKYAEIAIKNIKNSLSSFQGVKRRFTLLGKIKKAEIYDDYAHHPSEIKASYEIAKQVSRKKIIVIFQPHRYSRTQYLFNEFFFISERIF